MLVTVEAGWDPEGLIQWAHRLAGSSSAPWIVLYVETARHVSAEEESRLARNLELARELGAEVITMKDEDPVDGWLRMAEQRNVTEIIVGKPVIGRSWKRFQRRRMLRRLIDEIWPFEVHLVPVQEVPAPANAADRRGRASQREFSTIVQYLTALGTVALVTFAAFLSTPLIGPQATALVFLLSVVVLALFVPRGPTLFAAAMSALLWDFFFLPPIYAFRIKGFEDVMLFGIYFVIALVLGHLTARLRAQQEAERRREERATALYLLTRELTEATHLEQIVQRAVHHLEQAFKSEAVVLLSDNLGAGGAWALGDDDQRAAVWVLKHGHAAGKFTDNFSGATAYYVPLATSSGPLGVVGLQRRQSFPPPLHQRNLLDAFAQQIALALDRHRLQLVSESAKVLAESERLSKTLLDSMSHEIRTPIAAIQGATGHLTRLAEHGFSESTKTMIAEIQEATERLNRLVGNVLDITRLASGAVKPRLNECDVAEVVHLTVAENEKEMAGHPVTVNISPGLPIVQMDFVLMQQALSNLLSNAARHTPSGTPIQVTTSVQNDDVVLRVLDHGPGIPSELLPRIFDKFYRGPNAATGGTGLGLSLVKGFVEAQGGRVTAENGPGGGMIFTIRLPLRKTSLQPTL